MGISSLPINATKSLVTRLHNLSKACGSQTMRCNALVRRFNFLRASHKSKLSAVLFIELIIVKSSAIL